VAHHAPGLTPRNALEKLGTITMLDVVLPTSDGRKITMSRFSRPTPEVELLLAHLKLKLPDQAPPRIGSYDGPGLRAKRVPEM
jgi:hypothetical protein